MANFSVFVNTESLEFKTISESTITFGSGDSKLVFPPESRNITFNVILCISLGYYVQVEKNTVLDLIDFVQNQLFSITLSLFEKVFDQFVLALASRFGKSSNDINWRECDDFKRGTNQYLKFEKELKNNQKLTLENIILNLALNDQNYTINGFIGLVEKFYKKEEKLEPGKLIENRFKLIEPLSILKAQVWKAEDNFGGRIRLVAIKFLPITVFFTPEELKKLKVDKIPIELRTHNLDFKNMSLLSTFLDYMTTYKQVGYSPLHNMAYMIMDLFDGSIDKVQIFDKRYAIFVLRDMLLILHKHGYIFNNLSPSHIVKISNSFKLIDFKRLTPFKVVPETLSESGYTSLSLLLGNITSPHDDLESFFYICDFILNKRKLHFENRNDEISQKQNLVFCSEKIRNIIIRIRTEKQSDQFINGPEGILYPDKYVEARIEQLFKESVDYLLLDFKEIVPLDIELTEGQKELSLVLKSEMQNSGLFSYITSNEQMDIMVLKVLFYIQYDVLYDHETQIIIDTFLGITR